MAAPLATIAAPREACDFAVRQTALWPEGTPEPHFQEMLFRVGDGWIDTPLGTVSSSPSVFMTFTDDRNVDVTLHADEPVRALTAPGEVQQLFACLGPCEDVTIELYGDPEDGFARELRAHGGETTVRIEHLPGASYVADVPEEMPALFEDGRFHVGPDTPAPTVVETNTDALCRIVEAIEAIGGSTFPLVTDGERPRLDVARHNVFAEAPLEGRVVEGPPVHNIYGPAFARAVRTLRGDVRLETEPGGPLAIVYETADYVGRVLLTHC